VTPMRLDRGSTLISPLPNECAWLPALATTASVRWSLRLEQTAGCAATNDAVCASCAATGSRALGRGLFASAEMMASKRRVSLGGAADPRGGTYAVGTYAHVLRISGEFSTTSRSS